MRRAVLEDIEGFDEGLAYGEDKDLNKRVSESSFNVKDVDFGEKRKLVSSFGEVFSQGRWYGKSFLSFVRKYPENIDSLLITLYFFSMPVFGLFSLFSEISRTIFFAQVLFFIYLHLEYLRINKTKYSLLVPTVKLIRSYGIVLGMFEGLFTEDWGKAS